MPAKLPAFIDLRSLANVLVGQEPYRRVAAQLDRAAKAQSCVADLHLAQAQCEALSELIRSPRKKGALTRHATEGALLQMAVILYERATAAAAKRGERGSVSVVDQLTLAHVYPNEEIDGEIWQRDVLLAVERDRGWQPVAATQRLQFNRVAHERLQRQLPIMSALLANRYQRALSKGLELLNATPLLHAVFDSHRVDPVTVFGSEANARAALGGIPFGQVSFVGD